MKKVLFFSYYWPPSGKASLHWPLKIIKHLPDFECEPSVITIDEDTFSFKDETLLNDISPVLRVIKTKVFEPFNLYRAFLGKEKNSPLVPSETISKENKSLRHKISVWIRMNLFIPDSRIGWYPYAVRSAKQLCSKEKFDAIISVGPPHSTHLAAKKISRTFKIPFIPVFIDPWVDIVYYKNFNRSYLTLKIDNHLEKSVLMQAAHCVFVTESMKEDYEKKYSFIKDKSRVLYWGFNEEDFKDLTSTNNSEEKVILHAGNIFDYQNPVNFWKRLKKEIDKGKKYKLKFIGTVSPGIRNTLNEIGLTPYTEFAGFLSYKEMLQKILNANYLLVCASEKRHVPGKLFEYLRTGKTILAFGDDNKEVENIVKKTRAGYFFNYSSDGENFFTSDTDFTPDINLVMAYDRKNIAKELSELIKKIS